MLYLAKYTGPFGFIKPWTAVRDKLTFSQQFLTPSIVEGIEKKLFPELLKQDNFQRRITRHRLSYEGISEQQEQTQPKAWISRKIRNSLEYSRPRSILTRGTLIKPKLFLAFSNKRFAEIALEQHVCLSRNEDVLLPDKKIISINEIDFDNADNNDFHGFELRFERNNRSFLVGYNRFKNPPEPMYGWLHIVGNPVRRNFDE